MLFILHIYNLRFYIVHYELFASSNEKTFSLLLEIDRYMLQNDVSDKIKKPKTVQLLVFSHHCCLHKKS